MKITRIQFSRLSRWTIICCLPLHSFLIGQNSTTLSLQDALALGEKNYPSLKAKQEQVSAAQQDLYAARKEYLPTVKFHEQLSYGTSNTVQGTYFPYGIVVPTSGGIGSGNNYNPVYGSVSLGLLEWSPFSFGQYQSKVNIYRSQLDLATAQDSDEVFRQEVRIAEAYLNLLTLTEVRKVSAANLSRATVLLVATAAAAKNGLRPGADTAFAGAEVSRARLQMIDAKANEDEAKSYLALLIGLAKPNFEIDTLLASKLPSLAMDSVRTDVTKTPLAEIYKANLEISLARENNIRRSYYPKISVLGGLWGRGSGMDSRAGVVADGSFAGGVPLSRYNYAVGLALTFNAFDFYRIHSQWEAEHFRTEAMDDDYKAAILQMENQQNIADIQVRSAIERMNEAPVQLNDAHALYNQTNARYESGLATEPELAQSLYNMSRAENDMVNATDGLWRALLFKAASNGNLDEFISKLK